MASEQIEDQDEAGPLSDGLGSSGGLCRATVSVKTQATRVMSASRRGRGRQALIPNGTVATEQH